MIRRDANFTRPNLTTVASPSTPLKSKPAKPSRAGGGGLGAGGPGRLRLAGWLARDPGCFPESTSGPRTRTAATVLTSASLEPCRTRLEPEVPCPSQSSRHVVVSHAHASALLRRHGRAGGRMGPPRSSCKHRGQTHPFPSTIASLR